MWMLYDEFIYLLRDLCHRWPWHVNHDHEIRTLAIEGHTFCPITAACATVCQRTRDLGSYRPAAALLGMDSATADIVAQAADLAGAYNAHVRADISEALRLKERWGQEGRWNDSAFHSHPYPHGYDRPMVSGGIFGTPATPAGLKTSSPCTTRPATAPLPKRRFAIIGESARMRSNISALSAETTDKLSPPPPCIAPCGCASCSDHRDAG